jgi:xanthine dehydrogenase/oxidase
MIIADSAKHAEAGARAVKVEYEDLLRFSASRMQSRKLFPHYRYINKGTLRALFKGRSCLHRGCAESVGKNILSRNSSLCGSTKA